MMARATQTGTMPSRESLHDLGGLCRIGMPVHRRREAFAIVSAVLEATRPWTSGVQDGRYNELACYWD